MQTQGIMPGRRLIEFLMGELQNALVEEQVNATKEAEFYILNLLSSYHMIGQVPDLDDETKPLGVVFFEAMSKSPEAKAEALKRIGDGTLIALGFYPDSIRKGIVDPSFYLSIGGSAYDALADVVVCDSQFADVYAELAANFSSLVEVLYHIAPWNRATSNSELMMIYRRWLASGDEKLKRLLEREGIIQPED